MGVEIIAVQYLGTALIVLAVGLVICVLSFLGYNIYVRYENKNKKIEACAENTNSKPNNID